MSQKTYKVRNHKKIEHYYTLVDNVGEYLDLMASHDGRTMFVWKEKGEGHEITYGAFTEAVKRFSLGLNAAFAGEEKSRVRIAVIGETSPRWFASYLAVMAVVTYLIRMLPLTAFRKPIRSRFAQSFLTYIPFAVLGAMTFPDVLYSTGDLRTAAAGVVVAVFLSWRGKSLLTVAVAACLAVAAAQGILMLI